MNDYPSIGDLPGDVFDRICLILDSTAEHNWIKLLEGVPDYNHIDVVQLRNLAQRGLSPSRELLMNLNSGGWDVEQLAKIANSTGILSVVQVITDFCEEEDMPLNLNTNTSGTVSAKSCLHRRKYPTEMEPPTDMTEATRRYNLPLLPGPPPYSEVEKSFNNLSVSDTSDRQASPKGRTINQNTGRTGSCEKSPILPLTPLSLTGSLASLDNLEEVKYRTLKEATLDFDKTPYREGGHKVGEGGFGEVFQCSLLLKRGTVQAAVKVLLNKSEADLSRGSVGSLDSVDRKQFSTEIQALSKLSHSCLLPVLGYSSDGPQLCLIYPFMSNGSLEAHLPDHATLPPSSRLTIAADVASALYYLHNEAETTIVHRDIKSANVLLSEDWRGKLGDFGLARLLPSQNEQPVGGLHTATIVGTRVYMAPEATSGSITPAVDVYSMGVVLFELLTGKCALANIETEDGDETDLITFIEELDDEKELLSSAWEEEVWLTAWSVARRCVLHKNRRPTSKKVMEEISRLLPQPSD